MLIRQCWSARIMCSIHCSSHKIYNLIPCSTIETSNQKYTFRALSETNINKVIIFCKGNFEIFLLLNLTMVSIKFRLNLALWNKFVKQLPESLRKLFFGFFRTCFQRGSEMWTSLDVDFSSKSISRSFHSIIFLLWPEKVIKTFSISLFIL
jgi:hypothetical protein